MSWNKNLEKHPLNIFPAMDKNDWEKLYYDIQENGYDKSQPILLYEGKILDGWHRYQACLKLDEEPSFEKFEGTKEQAFNKTMRTNKRRNLKKSQWAALVAKNEDVVKSFKKHGSGGIEALARIAGCGFQTMRHTLIVKKINDELFKKIETGEISSYTACSTVRKMHPDEYNKTINTNKSKSQKKSPPTPPPPLTSEGEVDITNKALEEQWLHDKPYVYNKETDTYITFLKSTGKPIKMSGDDHRAMQRAYSDYDGEPATINTICRKFHFPRSWFIEYKKIHGWTHDLDPLTNEEHLELQDDESRAEAIEDVLVQVSRHKFTERFEKEKWLKVQRAADKWNQLLHKEINPFQYAMEKWKPVEPYKLPKAVDDTEKYSLIVTASDWQIGLKAIKQQLSMGKPWNTEIGIAVIRNYIDQILRDVKTFKVQWNGCYMFALGDLMHGLTGKTVSGTEVETDTLNVEQYEALFSLMTYFIESLYRVFGKVELCGVPGNHEGFDWYYLARALQERYSNTDGITINVSAQTVEYKVIGSSLFILTHGKNPYGYKHKIPTKDGSPREAAIQSEIINGMQWVAQHYPELASQIKNRYFIQGDNHFYKQIESGLYEDIQVGTPVFGDAYADAGRLTSRSSQSVLLFGHEQGIKAPLRYYFDFDKIINKK